MIGKINLVLLLYRKLLGTISAIPHKMFLNKVTKEIVRISKVISPYQDFVSSTNKNIIEQ